MEKLELVFIPAPGIGHLVSTVEFAKCLTDRNDRLSISILSMKFPFLPFAKSYTNSLVGSQPRIQIIDLPQVEPPPPHLLSSIVNYIYVFIESLIPHVRSTLTNILSSSSNSARVAGLILDFFCMPLMDVANELGLPPYMFLTSNHGFLSLMLHLPTRHNIVQSEFKDSDPALLLTGFSNPVPPSVLPSAVFDKDGYSAYVKLAQRFKDTKGIIVNSFVELEPQALNLLSDGQMPPIYMAGPVIDLKGQPHPSLDQAQSDSVMKWLDEQPPSSVVFLCFGSMGGFGDSQIREIASGLEQSGFRFLWSIRLPPPARNIDDILPESLLERIGERGKTCNGWVPQVEVLAHKAIGGFVSHCGWNSILESLWYGVPIATWPMYAEQQLNAFAMVKEFGLAVEIRLDYRSDGDLVMADEIELAVNHLMESDSEQRKKVKEMKEMSRKAVGEGGSSFRAVEKLIEDIVGSN
ncbi:hypothetical protein UlMin_013211 [Ulmus minor]